MQLVIELSEGIVRQFGDSPESAARSLVENALIEQYREGKLSIGQLGAALGRTRWEAEALLEQHGGVPPYTPEMLAEDRQVFAAGIDQT